MRLTNTIRDAFIHAAMNDVPQIDYQAQAEKLARDWLDKSFAATFPGVDKAKAEASGWLDRVGVRMPVGLSNLYTYAPGYECLKHDARLWDKLQALSQKHEAQVRHRNELKDKLHAVAYSVTTRKGLADALPEFEKYLPADEPAAMRSLPVVANVVADFVKAGWPKGAKAVPA